MKMITNNLGLKIYNGSHLIYTNKDINNYIESYTYHEFSYGNDKSIYYRVTVIETLTVYVFSSYGLYNANYWLLI